AQLGPSGSAVLRRFRLLLLLLVRLALALCRRRLLVPLAVALRRLLLRVPLALLRLRLPLRRLGLLRVAARAGLRRELDAGGVHAAVDERDAQRAAAPLPAPVGRPREAMQPGLARPAQAGAAAGRLRIGERLAGLAGDRLRGEPVGRHGVAAADGPQREGDLQGRARVGAGEAVVGDPPDE